MIFMFDNFGEIPVENLFSLLVLISSTSLNDKYYLICFICLFGTMTECPDVTWDFYQKAT